MESNNPLDELMAASDGPSRTPRPRKPVSGKATASMVLGITGLLTSCVGLGILLAIAGLVLGIFALMETSGGKKRGHGKAITGVVCSGITIVLIPVLIAILLPALGAARNAARRVTNAEQMRGIQQSMVIYAQGNNSHFPGVASDGSIATQFPGSTFQPPSGSDGNHPAFRYALLLEAKAFDPDDLINPVDENKTPSTGSVDEDHYSHAVLEISSISPRRDEWSETINAKAVVMSDRNTAPRGQAASVWDDEWRGTIVRNDNSTYFETSPKLSEPTRYGQANEVSNDHLFESDTRDDSDALMHYE